MEIVNSEAIRRFVLIIIILILLFTIFPIIIYAYTFDGNLSDSQTVWGAFGDYFGGIIGTLFNLIAVIFSLISIYITLKIATRLHENEQKFNIESVERETQRSMREIELIYKQNKPFPHVDINRNETNSEIIISNQGPGTLIIKNWCVLYEDKLYKSYGDLLDKKFKNGILFGHETSSKLIIATGSSKDLLDIEASEVKNTKQQLELCNQLLIKSKIKIEYEDIFENKFEIVEDLSEHE
jgi:uncharacterized membrane protein